MFMLFLLMCLEDASLLSKKEQRLRGTIELLRKRADFKPLKKSEAYQFIDQYFLPQLDSFPTKRKISMVPIKGIDFSARFEKSKRRIQSEYAGNANHSKSPQDVVVEPTYTMSDSLSGGINGF